ncbi:MAG: hypothetical protein Q7U51_15120 [Methanoregula sp.]|nr:hypothetical protein [Methanoregula sp.]
MAISHQPNPPAIGPGGVCGPHFTKTFSPAPANNPIEYFMDIQQLYVTFTNKKVVTSMLLLGIGLGLVLSAMIRYLAGKWYMPTAFVGLCLVVAIVYMYWLDKQDLSD